MRLKNSPDAPRHILWIRTDSIGDNVLAASMLGPIHAKYREARVTVLCQGHIAELYAPCPYVNHIVSFNKTLAYTDSHYRETIIMRLQALDVDLTMNSVYSRELIGDIFATRSGARHRVGFLGDLCNIDEPLRGSNNCYYSALLPSMPWNTPEIERHAAFLRHFGIEAQHLHPAVWSTPEDERFADEFFDRHALNTAGTLAVAPGSQNDYKIYPSFSEVLRTFTDFKLILLGGMDTVNVSGGIFEKFKGTCHNLTGKLTLRQTAAIIRRCRLLLSSDSAAAHIATAVGTRSVVVLGGGHFGRFLPYSPLTTAVCLPLQCYGCNWRCQFNEKYCITAIAPEIISKAIETSLYALSDKPQIAAQGAALWPKSTPGWSRAEEFLNTERVNIHTFNEIPRLLRIPSAAEHHEAAVGTNTAISAIHERLGAAASADATLALYESYLGIVPFDLNAARTADALRLDILRQRLPKITMVTPSYNQGGYLEECILSILTQGYPNLEYIIMDGGSSDNSVEIIKKYERHIACSRSAPDAGQYAAINEGMGRATGEVMGWLNSDDKLHSGALWIVATVFSAYSEVQWIMGRPTVWNADGALAAVLNPIPLWSRQHYLNGQIGPPHIQQESTFWRRRLWAAAGGYLDSSLRYAGDLELWARFFRVAELYSVDALIGGIRNHPAQKTAKAASDGSGCYDYADYDAEAKVIIQREVEIFNKNNSATLSSPPGLISLTEAALRCNDSIRPENFSCFTYSKQYHSAYFNNAGLHTADASIEHYRYNLMAAFAISNLPEGGKVLIAGDAFSHSFAELTGKYEIWTLSSSEIGRFNTQLPSNYFDLIAVVAEGQAACESTCKDIERLLRHGAFAMFFFDAAIEAGAASVNGLLTYVFSRPHITHPYVDISWLVSDPGALYFYNKTGKQTLSYNVLWKKTDTEPDNPVKAEPAIHTIKQDNPLATVFVIAHHTSGFIQETLTDIANQTIYGSLELIIIDKDVDNDTPGNTGLFIKKAREIVKNTVYICAPEGSSTPEMWNIALRASNGEFIIHVPKHSRLGSNALEVMSAALMAAPAAALVYGDTYLTMGTHESFEFHTCTGAIQLPDATYERLLVDLNLGAHPMWRKSVHDEIGYPGDEVDYSCERGLWLSIAARYKILHIPAFTGLMRHNPGSVPTIPEKIHAQHQRRYVEQLRRQLAGSNHIPCFIWGTGKGALQTFNILSALNITVSGFIDNNSSKWHTKVKGIEILPPNTINEKIEAGIRPFIVISSMYDAEIRPVLEGLGYVSRENYWTNIFRFKHAGFD
ncbi:MAG: glycosyltransferase [Nitrospirae bacterium]|nr:glycosyltransferase [Nitrospirota bacterium]